MATYSVASPAQATDAPESANRVALPDGVATSGTSTTTLSLNAHGPAAMGGVIRAAQLGTQVLCRNADGSSSYYYVDAENSDFNRGIVKMRRA